MKVLNKKYSIILIFLATFTYAVNNVGRSSFAANLTVIESEFSTTKQALGIVTSCLFFAYGGGQLFHSFFSKFYNAKFVVPSALIVSAICNLLIAFVDVNIMKYVWLVNGIAQSCIWCNILNVEAKYLPKSMIGTAIVWIGSSQCIGVSFLYIVSSIFAEVNWRVTFYVIFVLMIFTAILFYLLLCKFEKAEKEDEPVVEENTVIRQTADKPVNFKIVLGIICFIAVSTSFFRESLSVWTPSILKDAFGISDKYAIFITTPLLLLSIFGIMLSKSIAKRLNTFFLTMNILSVVILCSVVISIFMFKYNVTIIFILCMAVNVCLINGNASIITSQIPFHLKSQMNVGGISSLFDAFCYLGSMLSSVIVGTIADNSGWSSVLYVYLTMTVIIIVSSLLTFAFCKKKKVYQLS